MKTPEVVMVKSVQYNYIMNMLLTISTFIIPLITFPYTSRILLPSGNGKIAFINSIVTYFTMLSQLGIPIYGIRACAKVRNDRIQLSKLVQEIFLISIGINVVVYMLLLFSICLIPKFQQEKELLYLYSITICLSTYGLEWMYKGLEQYRFITVRALTFKTISVAAIFLLVKTPDDYMIYGIINVLSSVANSVFNLIYSRKYIDYKPIGNYHFKQHFKCFLVFFAISIATTVYTNLDNVMLGFLKGDIAVGYYTVAVKIKMILVGIVTSLGAVLLPRISYYFEINQKENAIRITKKTLNFVSILSIPLVIYFMIYAREGILFFAGATYEESVFCMQLIMPTVYLLGITNIFSMQILVPTGKEKIILYSQVCGAFVDLFLNMLLIPKYSYIGATIGTLIAEIVVFLVQYIYLKDVVGSMLKEISYTKIVPALIVAGWITQYVGDLIANITLKLMITAFLYFISYIGILGFLKEIFVLDFYNRNIRTYLAQWKSRIKKRISKIIS